MLREHIRQKRTWFRKFLLSYIIILLLPLMMVFSFLNQKVFFVLEKQLFQNQANTMSRLETAIDVSVEQLMSIHTELSLNRKMTSFRGMQDVAQVKELIHMLKSYTIANKWLYDMVIYFPGDEYLYTNSTSSTLDSYFSRLLSFQNTADAQALEGLMRTPGAMRMFQMQTIDYNGASKKLIPVYIPLQMQGEKQTISAVYFIDSDFLKNMVLSENSTIEEYYLVLDGSARPVAAFNNASVVPELNFCNHLQDEWKVRDNVEYQVVTEQGKQYMLCHQQSEESGFTYLAISSMKEIYSVIDQLKIQLVAITIVAGALGLAIVAYSMKATYGPIGKLTQYAKTLMPQDGKEEQDELKAIHSSMQHISTEYTKLKENSSAAFQNHFLQRLLQGEYKDSGYLDAIGGVSNVRFEKDGFAVLMLLFSKQAPLLCSDIQLQELCRAHLAGYLQRTSDRNQYVYIANFASQQRQQLKQAVQALYDELEQTFEGYNLVIAVGECCDSIAGVSQSYETAVLAADYRFVQGNHCIIWHDQLSFDTAMLELYPKKQFEQLRYALQRGETENVYPVLNEIIAYLKSGNLPLFYVRSLAYETINILAETLVKLGDETFSAEFLKTYSGFFADFDTIDELADALNQLSVNICLYIVEGILQEKDEKLYKIKREIDTNYSDINFSIQALAEHHGMTAAALSQYFKGQTGMTVMDYLTQCRMEKAKQLLREGELTLNEITEKIGYINTSSFIRRFKSLYGLTPRQYVASHPEQEEEQ